MEGSRTRHVCLRGSKLGSRTGGERAIRLEDSATCLPASGEEAEELPAMAENERESDDESGFELGVGMDSARPPIAIGSERGTPSGRMAPGLSAGQSMLPEGKNNNACYAEP